MHPQPFILHIAIYKPVRHCFDYLLPDGIDLATVQPGVRVLVPFGKKETIGIVLRVDQIPCFDIKKIKSISAVLDKQPLMSEKLLLLYQRASQYYQSPIGEVMLGTLPALLREKKNLDDQVLCYRLTQKGLSITNEELKRSVKQRELIILLRKNSLPKTLIKSSGFSEAVLSALLEKELIEKFLQKNISKKNMAQGNAENPLSLSIEQQKALDSIIATNVFKTFLLQGITGSGKTEVYLQAIDHCLKKGKQALVLVPEIGLTPQTILRFQRRFPVCIATFHSKLSDTERLNSWLSAKTGEARIIIGTRSSIFTPAVDLGVIILDEEHDASFKQQSGFRYSARDIAILRGQIENVPVVLGTATPSLESFYNTKTNKFDLLTLPYRAGEATLPIFHVLDVRNQYLDEGISSALLHAIKKHLDDENQVLLFLNRRGYAPVLLCHACGWSAICRRCDAKLTLHQFPPRLICHHCKSNTPVPIHCEQCRSNALLNLGIGTEKIEEVLKKYFPEATVFRIDRDTIRHKNAMGNILEKIKHGKKQILIGTQMLAKGHHFPNVTLVGILDIDHGFYSTDFRALEFMGQLITQVSGRAGRAEKPGEVYLQTHQPEHPLLRVLIEQGYTAFANCLLEERQSANWPPFSFLTLLRAEAVDKNKPLNFLLEAKKIGEKLLSPHIQLLGPIPAPMQKKAGQFRAMLLIQSHHRKTLQVWLNKFVPSIDQLASGNRVRWSLDVDPLEML